MNKMRTLIIPFILFAIFGCSGIGENDSKIEQEKVRKVFSDFIDSIEEGNPEGYFSFITDDFIAYEPGRDPIHNGDEFKKEIEEFFAGNTFKLSNYESQEVIVRNDIAIHRHRGTITIKPKADTVVVQLDVKYLDILRKNEKGDWKIYMHTVNPN